MNSAVNLKTFRAPEGVRNNARRGIELNEKVGNKCATQTGKVRAQQIANESMSLDTVRRMYSYLSRAETYYDESDTKACGTISYLLWGGKAGLAWARNVLREEGVDLAEVGPKGGVKHLRKRRSQGRRTRTRREDPIRTSPAPQRQRER